MKFLRIVNKINSLNTIYEVYKVTHEELKSEKVNLWDFDSQWDTKHANSILQIDEDFRRFYANSTFRYRKVCFTGIKLR